MEAASFTAQVIILSHLGQIRAGNVSDYHIAYTVCTFANLEGKTYHIFAWRLALHSIDIASTDMVPVYGFITLLL